MRNKLDEIIAWKRKEVSRLADLAEQLRRIALRRNDFYGFRAALAGCEPGLIAEVKKASPSAGVIASDFDPLAQAKAYDAAGADCLSILTDEKYFQGHLDHFRAIRDAVDRPLLRKDFIVHRHQLWESSAAGADCILLIVAALADTELADIYHETRDLGFDVLIEVHDLNEMDRALDLGADMIGINNRNLQTFEVSLETTEALAEEAPPDVLVVSESGIRSRQDVDRVMAAGADAILVGETLMRANDIAATIRELTGR